MVKAQLSLLRLWEQRSLSIPGRTRSMLPLNNAVYVVQSQSINQRRCRLPFTNYFLCQKNPLAWLFKERNVLINDWRQSWISIRSPKSFQTGFPPVWFEIEICRLLVQVTDPFRIPLTESQQVSSKSLLSITTVSLIFTSGSIQQYRPYDNRSHGSGVWWNPVPAHQLVWRGPGTADSFQCKDCS